MLHFEIKSCPLFVRHCRRRLPKGLNYRTFEIENSHAHPKVFSWFEALECITLSNLLYLSLEIISIGKYMVFLPPDTVFHFVALASYIFVILCPSKGWMVRYKAVMHIKFINLQLLLSSPTLLGPPAPFSSFQIIHISSWQHLWQPSLPLLLRLHSKLPSNDPSIAGSPNNISNFSLVI